MSYIISVLLILFIASINDLFLAMTYLALVPIPSRWIHLSFFKIKNKIYFIVFILLFVCLCILTERYYLLFTLLLLEYQNVAIIQEYALANKWNLLKEKYRIQNYKEEYINHLLSKDNLKLLKKHEKIMTLDQKDLFFNKTGQYHLAREVDIEKTVVYSFDPSDYSIIKEDYKRYNVVDASFKDNYKRQILRLFNGKCVNCRSGKDIELDHFIIPKSMGGNFIMFHKKGYKVINCIPLCSDCNKRKSNKQDFFEEETIYRIQKRLSKFQKVLNDGKYYI